MSDYIPPTISIFSGRIHWADGEQSWLSRPNVIKTQKVQFSCPCSSCFMGGIYCAWGKCHHSVCILSNMQLFDASSQQRSNLLEATSTSSHTLQWMSKYLFLYQLFFLFPCWIFSFIRKEARSKWHGMWSGLLSRSSLLIEKVDKCSNVLQQMKISKKWEGSEFERVGSELTGLHT